MSGWIITELDHPTYKYGARYVDDDGRTLFVSSSRFRRREEADAAFPSDEAESA